MSAPIRIHQAEFNRKVFIVHPEYGVPLADLMKPEYWVHVARSFGPGSIIEVQPDGLTYYAQLIVIEAGTNYAHVKCLHFVDLTGKQEAPEQPVMLKEKDIGQYKVERNGAWFRVVRRSDNEVMKTGFRTFEQAEAWTTDTLKA